MEILIITETKKKGKGIMELENGHILLYSGVDKADRAAAGVGCILHRNIKNTLHKWEAVSERIITIELKAKEFTKTIIGVYGPNEDEKAENKNNFWEELSLVTETARGQIYVMGDFNGRVGKRDKNYTTVIGKHGEDIRNNNGKRLLDYCQVYNLIITNTFFEHKEIHKYTREEISRGEKSIIDYILIERDNRSIITDVRVRRGAEINSDHYLLLAKTKEKLYRSTINNNNLEKKKEYISIKSYKLKNKTLAKKYAKVVNQELEIWIKDNNKMSIEELWNSFKDSILKAATQVCGVYKANNHKRQTSWWSEEIKTQIKIKKEKWQRYLTNRTEANYKIYKEQRKIVKELVKKAKLRSWEQFGEKLEKDSKGNQKLFYKVLKGFRNNKNHNTEAIKSVNGDILTDDMKIMDRWKEYFQNLLGVNVDAPESQNSGENKIISIQEDRHRNEITYLEFIEAIKKLKNGKAPGSDKVTAEMLKNLEGPGLLTLLNICNRAWDEEQIPTDWETGLIVPIFKKGDKKDCNNYRGITLLSTGMKLYEQIIEGRLRTAVEHTLDDSQSGFRKGRSSQDHIFTIKEIISRKMSVGKKVYLAFLDMEKAFDKVPRAQIWRSLHEREVNDKLIRVVKSLYRETKNSVISRNRTSEMFTTKEGVRQGGGLSPLLFIIFMDNIIKETNKKSKPLHVGYRNLQKIEISNCAFADDIVLITENKNSLQENLTIWNEVLTEYGMKINKEKTKIMVAAQEREDLYIQIDDNQIEQVNTFEYLGVTLEEQGHHETEINKRIEKANKVYHAMNKGFISKKEITKQTKMNVFKAIYRPILTYGCETWVLTQRQKSKVQAAEMRYLRRVKGVTRQDRIRNDMIREELKIQPLLQFVERRQLGWWGHLQRMNNTIPVKKIWEAKVHDKRKRGRPKETWDNLIGNILTRKGKSWTEAKRMAQNRKEWSIFVKN